MFLVTTAVNSHLKITVFYNARSDLCGVMAVVSHRFVFRAIHREIRLKDLDTPLYKAHTRFCTNYVPYVNFVFKCNLGVVTTRLQM